MKSLEIHEGNKVIISNIKEISMNSLWLLLFYFTETVFGLSCWYRIDIVGIQSEASKQDNCGYCSTQELDFYVKLGLITINHVYQVNLRCVPEKMDMGNFEPFCLENSRLKNGKIGVRNPR